MPKSIDLTGQRFGRYIAIQRLPGGRWDCVCDCGSRRSVVGYTLRSGASRSCGCLRNEWSSQVKRVDLCGKRFGRLTVKASLGIDKHHKTVWLCQCDCGKSHKASANALSSGRIFSCGCERNRSRIKDETGNSYGYLTVLRWWGRNWRGRAKWLCQCRCGNQVVVTGDYLRVGDTKSCGCLVKELAGKMGREIGKYNKVTDSLSEFASRPEVAESRCYLYFVEVQGQLDKIGITVDLKARGKGAFSEVWYQRELDRATAWCVEQLALRMTEHSRPAIAPQSIKLNGGLSELRQGLVIDETCELLDQLADEALECGWTKFAQRYAIGQVRQEPLHS